MTSDIARLRSLRATLDEIVRIGGAEEDAAAIADAQAEIASIEAKWSDADLLATYRQTARHPGDAEGDALLAEIERRRLDT
jgi:hypothetical protein